MTPMMTGQGMNPMMTGSMNPMMTGYPGMMGGFNPQHMFAAQQAAQAYQQAMMAFSAAGSQAGGDGGGGSPGGQQLNPMMSGGNMPAFDPRMSMMGMPMMGSPMGMGGMGLPMQMTGMSTFDPRFTPGSTNSPAGVNMNDPSGLMPPGGLGGPAHGLNQYSSRTSSPAGRGSPARRGSPLARPTDSTPDHRPASPKS